jgi:hypothetical protein
LTSAQEIAVKKIARELLQKLRKPLDVFRWRDGNRPVLPCCRKSA